MKHIPYISEVAACLTAFAVLTGAPAAAASADVNYDESKVPAYTLPDLLKMSDGSPVSDARSWREKRRPEILELFRTHVHGRSPAAPPRVKTTVREGVALDGKAIRRQVHLVLGDKPDCPTMDLLIYLPAGGGGPWPVFLGMNFGGNQTVHDDPGIEITSRWVRNDQTGAVTNNRASEKTRGSQASRWQIEKVLARGYATATIYYGDLEPDFAEGWKMGVRGYYLKLADKQDFADDDWGAIGAWAWGLSRAMDYLATDKDIDASKVVVHGHSRLGKTALWAGAQDERFAIVISNDSGEGGAAISRRRFGENIAHLNKNFPHWFCRNYRRYSDNETALPVDMHMLIALMAPRPVYVASAEEDRWADPKGEFLAAKHAEPAYRLFGKAGLGVEDMPPVNHPVGDAIAYHVRTGKHDITEYDWEQYLNFADRHFGRKR